MDCQWRPGLFITRSGAVRECSWHAAAPACFSSVLKDRGVVLEH